MKGEQLFDQYAYDKHRNLLCKEKQLFDLYVYDEHRNLVERRINSAIYVLWQKKTQYMFGTICDNLYNESGKLQMHVWDSSILIAYALTWQKMITLKHNPFYHIRTWQSLISYHHDFLPDLFFLSLHTVGGEFLVKNITLTKTTSLYYHNEQKTSLNYPNYYKIYPSVCFLNYAWPQHGLFSAILPSPLLSSTSCKKKKPLFCLNDNNFIYHSTARDRVWFGCMNKSL